MTLLELVLIIACAAISFAVAWRLVHPGQVPAVSSSTPEDVALLFDGDTLHHISDAAARWFPVQPGTHDWSDLRDMARDQFTNFPDRPDGCDRLLHAPEPLGADDFQAVQITRQGQRTRVVFQAKDCDLPDITAPVLPNHADIATRTAPHPMWLTNDAGTLIWSNLAFDALAIQGTTHPLLTLDTSDWQTGRAKRRMINGPNSDQDYWFDITRMDHDGMHAFHTQDASALVTAEEVRRNFVQTLAKTFAHLSIGLAIFDRNQQLALFNPALVDLSGLDPQFLSARPAMISFFDRLREARRMPEPKNYQSWRQEITDVIAAANDGRYQESWTLESGQTFRVTGRPHPDGATAFLIEDISAEVSLTRNFRAELEMGQVMLDAVDDAVVVFARSGVLSFCNAAYRNLWSVDPDNSFADVTIRDCITAWQAKSQPTPLWPKIEGFIYGQDIRAAFTFQLDLIDQTKISGELQPMPSGDTLIKFTLGVPVPAGDPKTVDTY